MLRFVETKVAKEKYMVQEKPINIWNVDVENKVISELVETKTNSRYLIGYLGKVVRPLRSFLLIFFCLQKQILPEGIFRQLCL